MAVKDLVREAGVPASGWPVGGRGARGPGGGLPRAPGTSSVVRYEI